MLVGSEVCMRVECVSRERLNAFSFSVLFSAALHSAVETSDGICAGSAFVGEHSDSCYQRLWSLKPEH